MTRRFTGWHITAIFVAFFGVVIAVNFTMAYLASSTFGGLVVKNSYVASQKYNDWLAKARAEKALGWTVDTVRAASGRVTVSLHDASGAPIAADRVTAQVRHPLGREQEFALTFKAIAPGRYESVTALPAGRWIAHVRVSAAGKGLNRIADLP